MTWQPIDTSPKDGSKYLVCNGRGNIQISFWLGGGGHWAGGDQFGPYRWVTSGKDALTHWQPLPTPPEAS